jgi:hypothetical protein
MSIEIALKTSDFAIIIYLVDITSHDARRSFLRPPTSSSPFGVKYSPHHFFSDTLNLSSPFRFGGDKTKAFEVVVTLKIFLSKISIT